MTDRVKFVFCESLANPGGVVIDIEPVAAIAAEWGVPLAVDNTLASPWLLRPFDWGADISIHSMTKFIGGHGNTMGGKSSSSPGASTGRGTTSSPASRSPTPPITGSPSPRPSAISD